MFKYALCNPPSGRMFCGADMSSGEVPMVVQLFSDPCSKSSQKRTEPGWAPARFGRATAAASPAASSKAGQTKSDEDRGEFSEGFIDSSCLLKATERKALRPRSVVQGSSGTDVEGDVT
jgi:hypothetical protein